MGDQEVTRRNFMVRAIIGVFVFIGAALAGRILYDKNGCAACHSIHGRGGTIGPDLTHAGSKRDRDWLIRHFKNPQALSPGSIMPKVTLPDNQLNELTDYMLSLK